MKISELNENLNRIHEWTRSADQKVSIWLAFQGVFITLISGPIVRNQTVFFESRYSIVLIITFVSFYAVSFYKSLNAIIPNLGKKIVANR